MGPRTAGLKAKDGFCLGRSWLKEKKSKLVLASLQRKKQGPKIPGVLVTNTGKVKRRKGKVSLSG